MLWTRKFIPVPGVSQVPKRPEKPSVTAYIARSRSLLKAKRARYSPTGLRHRSTKTCCSAGRTWRAAVSSMVSGSWSQVGATSSRICPISAVSAWLAFQSASEKKERNWLFISALFGSEEQVAPVRRGEEVVRVAPQHRDLHAG